MQVSLPVGLLIIIACFCLPVLVVYLVCKFMEWWEWINREPVVTFKDIYDADGKWLRRITIINGVPRMIVGFEEGGF